MKPPGGFSCREIFVFHGRFVLLSFIRITKQRIIKLQPGEEIILSSNGERIVLTNLRLYSSYKSWGASGSTYIYLEDISSLQSAYRSFLWFLLLAALCCLYGIVYALENQVIDGPAFGALFGLFLFVGLWWYSRRRVVSIRPNGGTSIDFETHGLSNSETMDFLEKVQLSKTLRLNKLYKL